MKQLVAQPGRYARAVVSHREDRLGTGAPGFDVNGERAARRITGFQRVAQQVEHHLFELDRISQYVAGIGTLDQPDCGVAAPRVRLRQRDRFTCDAMQRDALGRQIAVAHEMAQAVGNCCGTFGLAQDALNRLAQIRRGSAVGRYHRLASAGIGGDGGQWLVDFVRDGGGQFPHAADARHVGQLLQVRAGRFFGAAALQFGRCPIGKDVEQGVGEHLVFHALVVEKGNVADHVFLRRIEDRHTVVAFVAVFSALRERVRQALRVERGAPLHHRGFARRAGQGVLDVRHQLGVLAACQSAQAGDRMVDALGDEYIIQAQALRHVRYHRGKEVVTGA